MTDPYDEKRLMLEEQERELCDKQRRFDLRMKEEAEKISQDRKAMEKQIKDKKDSLDEREKGIAAQEVQLKVGLE